MNYEESVIRLEEIVSLLESGELTLEESLKLYEEGTLLTKSCSDILKNAEQKIININDIQKPEE